jgi:hypothetical protein
MHVDASVLLEALVAVGFFEGIRQLVRRFANRRAIKIDVAEKLQGMSFGFAQQMLERETAALAKADEVERKLNEIEDFVDRLLIWARTAQDELHRAGIAVPPIPLRRVR